MNPTATSGASTEKLGVSIVVPCFNEETALDQLHKSWSRVRAVLEPKYDLQLILVDDASTDATWGAMHALFQDEPNCSFIRHPANRGVSAAILTGIREAKTKIVCSIDSDCTYDPSELEKLIPMLRSGVDLVTGSPYHPLGEVLAVPGWRLFFSRTASRLYRLLLRQKLYTYTSCFRVYRRSAILKLKLRQNGFLGVAELIAKLDLQGLGVVECPTTLRARIHGTSKMKIGRAVIGHLSLLGELLCLKVGQALFHRRAANSQSLNPEQNRGTAI